MCRETTICSGKEQNQIQNLSSHNTGQVLRWLVLHSSSANVYTPRALLATRLAPEDINMIEIWSSWGVYSESMTSIYIVPGCLEKTRAQVI